MNRQQGSRTNNSEWTSHQRMCLTVLQGELIWWLYSLLNMHHLDVASSIFLFVSPIITMCALIGLPKSAWRSFGLVVVVMYIGAGALFYAAICWIAADTPPRAYRNNQHELLRDGRCVDIIFRGHDAKDGSFLVQTSRHKGLLSVTLKSRPLALAAEPDLRILPSGRAVLFVKSETGKEPSQIGLDEFLEGVAKLPDYK